MTTTFPRMMGYGLGTSLQRGASAFGPWVTADPYDYSLRDQSTAPSFPPFKFEPRRARIDWRLLHGIDINAMMRDVDLDTLEKIVNIVAFGDIEAEDTRHLTELNFIKIFRLSQMMIEYLLYVQDCLQNSNAWLQQDRAKMDKYVQAARLRIRELEANLKMNKRELRRTRKTIKTYELLAVLNDGKGATTGTIPSAAATAAPAAAQSPPPAPPPPQSQAVKSEPNPINIAMETLLRKELAVLGERLSKVTFECQTLRSERDDLYQAVKDLEATVKAKAQLSGASSPMAYSRHSAEAMQTIQGLQDQLNRATVEIAKLRTEKDDLSEELERANGERRQLQDEKSRLLSELASRSSESPQGISESPHMSENLGSMLLEADRQKAALQDQLADAKAEITQLQKELMKAMKATAFGGLPPPQAPDDRAVRELESAKTQLEKELAEVRRVYNEDMRQLQEELETAQTRAVDADRRLSELRERDAGAGMSPPRNGGFLKVVEDRRPSPGPEDVDHGADRHRALLAEYEATNERLNQQLIQLKGERNTLAGEVEQLRLQLQNRASPPQGDRGISRDWRTEEIERLKDERDTAHRRVLDLEDALRDRDALIERLRTTIRDLQAQLAESRRQQTAVEVGPSRVKQQVKQFERLADPTRPLKAQTSFSFAGDSPPGSGTTVDTPTSMRRPPLHPELAPSPHLQPPGRSSPPQLPPSIPEEPEQASGGFVPPSPKQSGAAPGVSQAARWLRRIPRPRPPETAAIQQQLMMQVAGASPENVHMRLREEIRVITENPFEYENDDEERFRALMPHEVEERKGVRCVEPHILEDLATARSLYTDQLLAVVDDELAQYGVDLEGSNEMLGDKAYLACMQELAVRRSKLLGRYPKEVQDRAEELRSFLLTHIELLKRDFEQEQRLKFKQQLEQQLQQQRQQQQQQDAFTATGPAGQRDDEDELEIEQGQQRQRGSGGSAAASEPAEELPFTVAPQLARNEPAAGTASVTLSQGLAAAAAAASKPLSAGAAEAAATATAGAGALAAGTPPQRQLPAFPSRQPSLQRSSNPPGDTAVEDLRSMLPPAPAGASRPTSETTRHLDASQRSTPAQSVRPTGGSTPASREASVHELHDEASRRDAGQTSGPTTSVTPLRRSDSDDSGDSGADPRQQSMRSGQSKHSAQSLPRSATSARSQPNTGPTSAAASAQPSAMPTPVMLRRDASAPGSPERVTLGHARPTPAARPGAAAAAAAAPGGNMNMSIRSVKYQESDFDDDEDDMPLPQPKPVRRLADEEDEYALTEDEEAQQDMGIEDIDEFSAGARQPAKILMGGSPQRPVPSRLGMQPTPATTQARGWATAEPLQPAPERPRASHQASETAEVEVLESIQSFENINSQSIKRSPGAWGSPSTTIRKPNTQSGRDPSTQLSVASKQSGWNEAITSFGVNSGVVDEVQAIQDFTESFNESIRPMGRMMGQQPRGNAAASSQVAPPQPRTITRRASFSDDLSEIEYA